MLVAALATAAVLASFPCRARGDGLRDVHEIHPVDGGRVEFTIVGMEAAEAHAAIRAALGAARGIARDLSAQGPSGPLARLNAAAGQGPVMVPPELYRLLSFCRLMTRATGGAFDVTFLPLLRVQAAPDGMRDAAVDEALLRVGSEKIVLHHPDRVELPEAGMGVDLAFVQEGYAMERMAAALRAHGVRTALLEGSGGTVVAIGPPAGQPAFQVPILRGYGTLGTLRLRDRAVSTLRVHPRAGDGGARAPFLDPRSGRVLEADRQATAVARDAAIAEAWAAALVVDPDGAMALLDEPRDVTAIVYDEHGQHRNRVEDPAVEWMPSGLQAGGDAAPSEGSAASSKAGDGGQAVNDAPAAEGSPMGALEEKDERKGKAEGKGREE